MNESNWIVLKFGGTSVASPDRWETIAEVVRVHRRRGYRPLVVCSALSGITDALERLLRAAVRKAHEAVLAEIDGRHAALANALSVDRAEWVPAFEELKRLAVGLSLVGRADPALRARILAQGELMSTRIGAAYLAGTGLRARWLDARMLLHAAEEPSDAEARRYLSARCAFDPDEALQERLARDAGDVFVTQGFIAGNAAEETVLLGRGGSDASAAYLAAKLQAERLEIWTDVPGLFTADPRVLPSARLLRHLDYDEAQELATMGAKVLHPRCLAPVRQQGIPLYLRSTPAPEIEGTVVSSAAPDGGPQVKALSAKAGVTLIEMRTLGMWQQVGFLADVFAVFKRHGLSIDLMATSETDVTVSLDPVANAIEAGSIDALLEDLRAYCHAEAIGPCAAVSLIGRDIRALLHRLGPVFEVFEEQRVHLVSQAASDLNLSFVVEEEQAPRLMRELHAQLFDTQPAGPLFGPSWRTFSEEPAEEAAPRRAWWHERRPALLQIAETHAPVYVYDEATLRASVEAIRAIEAIDRVFYAVKANPNPGVLRLFEEEGLDFECVSPGELEHVRTALPDLSADRLLFTPNFAPRAEYACGRDHGAHVTLDNLYPLEAWPDVFEGQDLILRVDPGQGRGHHQHVRTAGTQSKFGIAATELRRAATLVERAGARIVGLHAHVGSGIVAPETWAETAAFLAAQADIFPDVHILNVGGGLGVVEHPGSPALDVDAVAESLAAFKAAHPQFELWMEPGRFLVAEAGVLLARVTQLKRKSEDRHYVGLETGMNSLIRPALYGSHHEIRNLTRLDAPDAITADVVGPICESGDVLGHSRRLPETQEGDCLLIAATGAYAHAMHSHYNLREPAAEMMLRVDEVPA